MLTENEMAHRRMLARIGVRLRRLQDESGTSMNCLAVRAHYSAVRAELNTIADDIRGHLRDTIVEHLKSHGERNDRRDS